MYLGFDLGTSGLRAVLCTPCGRVTHSAEHGFTVSHPHAGWSEQDPSCWIEAAEHCVNDLKQNAPNSFADLTGIGLSGQMHGAVLLDVDGQVLRPCILWNDTRSHLEAARLDQTPPMRVLSGNIVFPGFTAPKLAWLRHNEPEIFAKIHKVVLPKDYLRLWLTGEVVSDMSDAAGTSWLDVGKRAWSTALLDASAMRVEQMPQLVEGSAVSGTLRASLAADWGVLGSVVVAGGGGDNAAAACGVGTIAEGDGFVSLGTSGVLLSARNRFAPMPQTAVHTFCHAIPETWYQMGVTLAATDSLNWLARLLGQTPAALSAAIPDTLTAPEDVQFLPYLSGERTPHNDATIRGGFVNLDIASGAQELTRAVMQGVAFAQRDSLDALRETGANPQHLLAIGGGTGSRYWLNVLASVLDLPIQVPRAGELGAALGACRLAICATTGAAWQDVMTKPEIAYEITPNPDFRAAYFDAQARYRAAYPALRSLL